MVPGGGTTMHPSLVPEACDSWARANFHQLSGAEWPEDMQYNAVSFAAPTGTNNNLRPGTRG
jgi:hypothetical protein